MSFADLSFDPLSWHQLTLTSEEKEKQPKASPKAQCFKLFTEVIYEFECLSLPSLSSLV